MGNCASAQFSEMPDHDTYGHENTVNFKEISGFENGFQVGSTYSHGGSKGQNQDSSILFQDYGVEGGAFCGVFDGHGKDGHLVSKIVRNRLPSLLLIQRNAIAKISPSMTNTAQNDQKLGYDNQSAPTHNFLKWREACITAFKAMDKEIKILDNLDCSCSGTAAAVVVKQGEDLLIANLGDSRAVLGTMTEDGIMATQLTTDLKPGVQCEMERIRKCNGRVLALKEEPHIQRVWLPHDDSPGLAMSRAFGDFVLKNHGIIAIPDISYHHISPNDQFLVVATDGVWDVLSNDEIISIVSSAHNEGTAAKAVVDAAIASWSNKYPNSRRDDCTVVCLFLNAKGQ